MKFLSIRLCRYSFLSRCNIVNPSSGYLSCIMKVTDTEMAVFIRPSCKTSTIQIFFVFFHYFRAFHVHQSQFSVVRNTSSPLYTGTGILCRYMSPDIPTQISCTTTYFSYADGDDICVYQNSYPELGLIIPSYTFNLYLQCRNDIRMMLRRIEQHQMAIR